jgi:hypothetical protein
VKGKKILVHCIGINIHMMVAEQRSYGGSGCANGLEMGNSSQVSTRNES